MTLGQWCARKAVLSARERLHRAERRCNTKEINRARKALIRAVAWKLNEERV